MANLVPPEALKSLKPYVTLASQLEQKNEKCVAYYCRLYAIQLGMSLNKSQPNPDSKKFLFQLMDLLEITKNQNKNDETITSQVVGQAVVERYALKLFEKADDDDRQSRFNKNLVKAFYSAGLLFDILNYFGDLSEDLVAKKQYAKRKAMYLNRCFQTGEQPVPGPLVNDSNEVDEFGANESGGQNNSNYSSNNYSNDQITSFNQPPPSNSHLNDSPSQRPTSSSHKQADIRPPSISNYQEEPAASSTSSIPPDQLQKAQKFCKFAASALQYEDITTAIKNLEDCLKILKTN